ncbi:TPA: hypothetical protein DCL30_03600 [Candidatus Peribacteria bacterium]|nr:MAG: hypothetical protein A3J91_05890 [Candidatus Peribacteria bacterium RIFOXYC2_FULL_58_10]OGJ83897.1 MAG: hypothetical protein A2529_04040 [Candidatus Peribacteria bacterium RIFOXYD2_FULL_58_15]HAI98591.1 hypothetical protein [Candidatus Peribacteria bacterium]HAS34304.1 hypothetical protein [Candidatus Peribacteria bacterium]
MTVESSDERPEPLADRHGAAPAAGETALREAFRMQLLTYASVPDGDVTVPEADLYLDELDCTIEDLQRESDRLEAARELSADVADRLKEVERQLTALGALNARLGRSRRLTIREAQAMRRHFPPRGEKNNS